MSKRITVSIPDKVVKAIEPYEDKMNFSEIFQRAVLFEAQRQELFKKIKIKKKGDVNMDAIIERLKQEKEEVEKSYREKGKEDGYEWAITAHYQEIQEVLKWNPRKEVDPYPE